MAHAVLDLRVAHSVASHGYELLGPKVYKIRDFARSHNDAARERNAVVLQEFVLLEAALEEHFSVVADDVGLALAIKRHNGLRG